jgi:CspA family cold shock protein
VPDDRKPSKKLMSRFPRPFAHVRARNLQCQENEMTIGTVKFFNTAKGFGFIAPEGGGKDVFVHATAVEAAGMRSLNEGDKVTFDVEPDARGSKAVNLKSA